MLRPEGDKAGRAELAMLTAQVQGALELIDGDAADALIGDDPDEHRALIRAANAVMTIHWMAMKANGVRDNGATLRMQAQAQVIVLDLVHKSFALGLRGR